MDNFEAQMNRLADQTPAERANTLENILRNIVAQASRRGEITESEIESTIESALYF